jgi:hypothetical protein
VITEPPSEPAVKATDNAASCEVIAKPAGALGTVCGVTELDVAVAPEPAGLTAFTLNVYEVPLTKPVTVVEVEIDKPSANTVHSNPSLNSTT